MGAAAGEDLRGAVLWAGEGRSAATRARAAASALKMAFAGWNKIGRAVV